MASTTLVMAQQSDASADNPANLYSLEKEAALGKQLASEVRRRTTPIEDPSVQEYVNNLGHRLAMEMPDAKTPFTFSVIADDPCETTHEPGSLPGGYIFIPAALFIETHGEAEFAGMLAHSMEHVVERHYTRQVSRASLAQERTIPLIFLGGWTGTCSERFAVPAGFRAMQSSQELEADRLAVQALARAGFDPAALVSYIQLVQASPAKSFSLLPTLNERVSAMTAIVERLPASNYEVTRSEFLDIQQKIVRSRRPESVGPPTLRRK